MHRKPISPARKRAFTAFFTTIALVALSLVVTTVAHATPAPASSTITVQVGGDRTGDTTVGGLGGVQLSLYTDSSGSQGGLIGQAWSACTSTAAGVCTFTVPDTGSGGANNGKRFWVGQTGTPAGYVANAMLDTGDINNGTDPTAYAFRTPAMSGGSSVTSGSSTFMGSGNSPISGGTWQDSRTDPSLPAKCGLKVALIVDLSTSVQPYVAGLRSAATAFVNGLAGTPSAVSLYTFGSVSPAPNTTNHAGLTSVADAAGASTVNGWISALTVGGDSYTNWDSGFYQAAQQMDASGINYDAAVIITDGNPTTYGPSGSGQTTTTNFRHVENGIFSANAIKSHGTRVVAFGVGVGITGSVENLAAISGHSGGASGPDYYQTSDYTAAGNALRALALGNCAGSVTVVKKVVPANGDTSQATASAGWTFNASTATNGVTINPNSGATAAITGAFNFPITFPGGTTSAAVTLAETQQANYTLLQQSSKNATCSHTNSDGSTTSDPVTNSGNTGFTVSVPSTAAVSCLVYNEIVTQPTLKLVKTVDNSNGGSAVASNWTLNAVPQNVAGQSTVSGAGGFAATSVVAGSYVLGESGGPSGYSASAWVCSGNATPIATSTLTLHNGEAVTCTVTNTAQKPSLALTKTVVNSNGGTAVASNWTLTATPQSISGQAAVSGAGGFAATALKAGTYTLSESGPAGYSASGWNCTGNATAISGATLTVNPGETVSCALTNTSQAASLALTKIVDNGNGGNAVASNWTLTATPQTISGQSTVTGAGGFAATTIKAGSYTLAESGPTGYTPSSWSCSGNSVAVAGSTLAVKPGETVTCTIINTSKKGSLALAKTVDNSNGGTAVATEWTLTATPQGIVGQSAVSGAGGFAATSLNAGNYLLSEIGPTGYAASAWTCTGNAAPVIGPLLTVGPGETVSCGITNSSQKASLTLTKVVDNGSTGATNTAASWTLTATPSSIAGQGTVSGAGGFAATAVKAGGYTLGESGPAGYTASAWTCTNATPDGATLVLQPGQTVSCTITNTANASKLALTKVVVNSNGGSAVASDWTLTATPQSIANQTAVSGAGGFGLTNVKVGTYVLTETGPSGYAASIWTCAAGGNNVATGATGDGQTTLTVALGQAITCTITNTDKAGSLTLSKIVDNSNGGSAVAANWTLTATPQSIAGQGAVSGAGGFGPAAVKVGTYTLGETGPAGYTASSWTCSGNAVGIDGNTLAMKSGETVICTIINSSTKASLTVTKIVDNGTTGATGTAANWTLTATPQSITGQGTVSGAGGFGATSVKAGSYALGETGLGGYTASSWTCNNNILDGSTVALQPGQTMSCTITNTARQPKLALGKIVVNSNGGTSVAADWTLSATPQNISGQGTVSGAGGFGSTNVKVGTYLLSETGPAGYTASAWTCTGNATPVDGATLTVGLGETVSCAVTNSSQKASLTLVKVVDNSNGGSAVATDWTLTATPQDISGQTTASGAGGFAATNVKAGSYLLGESGAGNTGGYTASAWNCTGNSTAIDGSSLTLKPGEQVSCTVTNASQQATLSLTKVVDNGATGATAVPANWTVSAAPQDIVGQDTVSGAGAVPATKVNAGSYNLGETGLGGYTASAWTCDGGSLDGATLTLQPGVVASCTITNTAVAPLLTLVKHVVNSHGGSAAAADFTLTASGPSTVSGRTGSDAVTNASAKVGTYTLSESGPSGYTASAWSCRQGETTIETGTTDGGATTLAVALGQSITCSITNTDDPAALTLAKVVDNGQTGSTATPSQWTLTAVPQNIEGQTTVSGLGDPEGNDGVHAVPVFAGSYALSEFGGPSGFQGGVWTCAGGTVDGSTVTIANGASVTCSITNTAVAPLLTLVKKVDNGAGGTAQPTDFTLTATGPVTVSGKTGSTAVTAASVQVGTYVLSESGPAGYTASAWNCTAGTLSGASLTLALGQSPTCSITNTATLGTAGVTVVRTPHHSGGGSLALTGAFITRELKWALGALVVGFALLLIGRRRRAQ